MAKTKKPADKAAKTSAPVQAAPEVQTVEVREVDAPVINASAFYGAATATEILVGLLVPKLTIPVQGGVPNGAVNRVIGVLSLSPQACKDLAFLLSEMMKKFEAEHGSVNTPFTRRLADAPNGKSKKSH